MICYLQNRKIIWLKRTCDHPNYDISVLKLGAINNIYVLMSVLLYKYQYYIPNIIFLISSQFKTSV